MSNFSEHLLGKSNRELRLISGTATHQHYKGGLYRLVGEVRDADTGEPVLGKDGLPRVLYQHCYPYADDFWVRDAEEFHGLVVDPRLPVDERTENHVPRFRRLG